MPNINQLLEVTTVRRFLKLAKVILSLVFLALKILKQILDFLR